MLSILFNIAIAVFAIVAASHGWVNTYLGCNGKFTGVMETWRGIDSYLQRVDQSLCSNFCPCYISNITDFVNNATIAPFYSQWTKSPSPALGVVSFPNCSQAVQNNVLANARASDSYFDPSGDFKQDRFYDYMANVETDFECSGWCNVTYQNTQTGNTMVMFKYMFTDINRGVPKRLGCLNSVIEWLPPYLNAFGSMTMLIVGFQVNDIKNRLLCLL
jgi:hypothetical protein